MWSVLNVVTFGLVGSDSTYSSSNIKNQKINFNFNNTRGDSCEGGNGTGKMITDSRNVLERKKMSLSAAIGRGRELSQAREIEILKL